ncbi:MAG: HIT domain-containing protein, partial [Holosporales bacterium]|nr:HIT domain-containing protein [Holosporales bacterium]
DVLAFNDIHPAAPIHVLVISKGAYVSFDDFSARASEQEIYRFWQSIYKTRKTLNISAKGYRLITNTGIDGGQEVPHFHVHILAGKALGAKVCA